MTNLDFAYWAGRFKAIVEAVAGEIEVPLDVQVMVAQSTLADFRHEQAKVEREREGTHA